MYTPIEAILLFVGIPLATILLVVVCVYAPGWVRANRDHGAEDNTGPVTMVSPRGAMTAPHGSGIETPKGPTEHTERGGASGTW